MAGESAVDRSAMATAAQQVESAVATVRGLQSRLSGFYGELMSGWQGQAASAFGNVYERFNSDFTTVISALEGIHERLVGTRLKYESAEEQTQAATRAGPGRSGSRRASGNDGAMTGDYTRAVFGQLLTSVADFASIHSQMVSTLSDLEHDLQGSLSAWQGDAQEAYWAAKAKWDAAAGNMENVLNQLRIVIGEAHANYTAAEAAGSGFDSPLGPPTPSVGGHEDASDFIRRREALPREANTESSPKAGAPQASAPERRYLLGRCPDLAPAEIPFSVVVRVAQNDGAPLRPFHVPPEGRDVLLVLYAPGLQVLGGHRRSVRVPDSGDSEPVMFELLPSDPGVRRVEITAWSGGSYLGELKTEVTVTSDGKVGQDRELRSEVAAEPVDGEVSLLVRYDPAQRGYRFEFIDTDFPGEVTGALSYDPGPAIERLVRDLDALASGRDGYSAAQTRDYLVNAGVELWEELIPGRLRAQFWERQHRIRQLTILADRDTVPWELLYPKDHGHDAGFLVEQFPVTRAVFGCHRQRRLRLDPAWFVLPPGSPTEAETEIEALRSLEAPEGRRARTRQHRSDVISRLKPLLELIRSGDAGVLHFACHNGFDPADGASIRLDAPFVPRLLTTAAADQTLARAQPVVFINGCRSAGQAPQYNRLDGWADKFMRAGAAAFIGSQWAVSDSAARRFAAEFYRWLRTGDTLGQAIMRARQAAASEPGDPTWLAYTVYGDPRATAAS